MWSSASTNSEPISISSNECPPSVMLLEKVLAPLNVCVPDKWAVSASKYALAITEPFQVPVVICPDALIVIGLALALPNFNKAFGSSAVNQFLNVVPSWE